MTNGSCDEPEAKDITNGFFALISRMRYISRWGLMRNSYAENLQEHSHMVAVLAHALAVIRRDVFQKDANPDACAAAALFHDASEILTGDMPTPIKYHSRGLTDAYREVEALAGKKLLSLLPPQVRGAYVPLLGGGPDEETRSLIKAADKLAAYIKCLEELRAGNDEFLLAERQIRETLAALPLDEVDYFIKNFIPAFELTLDELGYSLD